MERIDSLNKDQRIGPDPATFEDINKNIKNTLHSCKI